MILVPLVIQISSWHPGQPTDGGTSAAIYGTALNSDAAWYSSSTGISYYYFGNQSDSSHTGEYAGMLNNSCSTCNIAPDTVDGWWSVSNYGDFGASWSAGIPYDFVSIAPAPVTNNPW